MPKNGPLRIAHLPSSFFPDSVGGTEVYVEQLTAALAHRGVINAVVVHRSAGGPATEEIAGPDHTLFRLPPISNVDQSSGYLRNPTNGRPDGFAEFLDSWRPDFVHLHAFTLGAGIAHVRLAKQRGIPYVLTYHTPSISCARTTLMAFGKELCDGLVSVQKCSPCFLHSQGVPATLAHVLGRSPIPYAPFRNLHNSWPLTTPGLIKASLESLDEFLHGAAAIVCPARWVIDMLSRMGIAADKLHIMRQSLPGGTRQRQLRMPQFAENSTMKVGFCGRVTPEKGIMTLLDAVTAGNKKLPQRYELTIAGPMSGDTGWSAMLTKKMQNCGAKYAGVLRGDDLNRWFNGIDVLAVPSEWMETGPLVLLEAWDRGIPVIGSRLGGIVEFMVQQKMDDWLYEAGNSTQLLQALERLRLGAGNPTVEIRGNLDTASRHLEVVYR